MWWVMIFRLGSSSKMPGVDQPRHAGGGLVGPAEAEPDLVLRRLLAGVVGKIRPAHRMHPDRQVVRGHAAEDRPELGRAQRLAGDVGEHLDAARAELRRPRGRSRRAQASTLFIGSDAMNAGKRSRMPAAELGQRVVGDARELRRLVGRRDQLERRIGEREHLLQVVELVEQASRASTSHSVLSRGKRGDRDMAGNELGQAVEIRLRHEMIEDVDDHEQDEPRERESRATVKAKQIICYSARVAGRAA